MDFFDRVARHWDQFLFHPVFAALIGALGAAFHTFPGATRGTKMINGVLSFFAGIYFGGLLVEWRNLEGLRTIGSVYAGAALGGLVFVNAALEYLKTTPIAQWPVIRNILGSSAPGLPTPPANGPQG
jgi:hypothetical protein